MEGIKRSKPNTRPFGRVIPSFYSQEIFVHQVHISGKCTERLRKYPNFSVIFKISNKKSTWAEELAKNYFSIFNNYKDRDAINLNTWRSSYQTQAKINTFMSDTKHQKYLERFLPIGEMYFKEKTLCIDT